MQPNGGANSPTLRGARATTARAREARSATARTFNGDGFRALLVAVTVAQAAGCSAKSQAVEDVPNLLPSAEPRPSAKAPAPAPAEPPAVLAIRRVAQALEGCALQADVPLEACAGWAEWTSQERAWFEGGERDALLVELTGSKSEMVRYAAAGALISYGSKFATSKPLAERLLGQTERELDPVVGPFLARVITKLDYDQVGMAARAGKLLVAHPNRALRLQLITDGSLLPGGSELVAAAFDDPDLEVQRAVIEGLWLGEEEVACRIYKRALAGTDFLTADKAAYSIAFGSRCASLVGDVLKWAADSRAVTDNASIGATLGTLCGLTSATPQQRLQALTHAKRFSARAPSSVRVDALKSVMSCDPKTGRYFIQRYANDPEPAVKQAASKLLQAPAKPAPTP